MKLIVTTHSETEYTAVGIDDIAVRDGFFVAYSEAGDNILAIDVGSIEAVQYFYDDDDE